MNHQAQFHIVAPMLKYMSLSTHIRNASVSAPNLEKFSLDCSRSLEKMQLAGNMGQLQELKLFRLNLFNRGLLWIGDGVGRLLQQLPRLHVLRIDIAMVCHLFLSWLCMTVKQFSRDFHVHVCVLH
ncbi:unnamed protein product [Urochloa humidicola]